MRIARRRSLGCQVVNQSERVFDITSWKIRLILNYFATLLHKPESGFFDTINGDFQNWPKRWASFDE